LIGDVPSATAILDRFLHRSELIQITGKSYRMENSPPHQNLWVNVGSGRQPRL
jgi:DNA replication protein DnaC